MEETKFARHEEQVMSGQSENRLKNLDFSSNSRSVESNMYLSRRVPFEESYSKSMGSIQRYNLSVTRGCVTMSFPGGHQSGKTVPQNLRGLPDRGE